MSFCHCRIGRVFPKQAGKDSVVLSAAKDLARNGTAARVDGRSFATAQDDEPLDLPAFLDRRRLGEAVTP